MEEICRKFSYLEYTNPIFWMWMDMELKYNDILNVCIRKITLGHILKDDMSKLEVCNGTS